MIASDRWSDHPDSSHQKPRHQEPGDWESRGHTPSGQRTEPVDFAFLAVQTFHDGALEREVLALFVEQARRLIPTLPNFSVEEQSNIAHLLRGSACGIGAWAVAEEAALFETAEASARPVLTRRLAAAFEHAETAILARLGETREDAAS